MIISVTTRLVIRIGLEINRRIVIRPLEYGIDPSFLVSGRIRYLQLCKNPVRWGSPDHVLSQPFDHSMKPCARYQLLSLKVNKFKTILEISLPFAKSFTPDWLNLSVQSSSNLGLRASRCPNSFDRSAGSRKDLVNV